MCGDDASDYKWMVVVTPTAILEDFELHGPGHLRQLQLELLKGTVPDSLVKVPLKLPQGSLFYVILW